MDIFYIWDYIWGLGVLVSWAGWGTILRQSLKISGNRSADWGLRIGWGAATTIAIGGVLNLCRISFQPVVIGIVVIGLVAEASRLNKLWRRRAAKKPPEEAFPTLAGLRRTKPTGRRLPKLLFIGPCVVALAFLYTGSVHQPYWLNPYDDYLAYLVFPIRMLQTGTFIEPFSQRRLGTFGGHAFLTAMVFSGTSPDMAWALEMGMCPIVIAGLIYGFLRPRTARQFLFAGLLIVLSFLTAVPRANSQSLATGVMLFLTLFRTVALENGTPLQRRRIGWATIIVVAAVSTLRVNNLIAAFAALILSRLFTIGRPAKERMIHAGVDAASAMILILPWSILMIISSGTFLYPLMKGNERGLHLLLRNDVGPAALLRWIAGFLCYGPVPIMLAPLALPVIFKSLRQGIRRRAALFVAAGGLIATIVTIGGSSPAINWYKDLYRMTFPIIFSVSLAVLTATMSARYFIGRKFPNFAAAAAILIYVYWLGDPTFMWNLNIAGMERPSPSVALYSFVQADYRDLQYSIPQGASFLAILNYPNLLDYRRNEIRNADMLLPYGPYPGPPFFKGPDALRRYLNSLGIHYVAAVDFDEDHTSWYSRPNDLYRVMYSNPSFPLWQPYFFDYMDNIDALERRSQILFKKEGLRVFRIDG
jgi:hypothetical protein